MYILLLSHRIFLTKILKENKGNKNEKLLNFFLSSFAHSLVSFLFLSFFWEFWNKLQKKKILDLDTFQVKRNNLGQQLQGLC